MRTPILILSVAWLSLSMSSTTRAQQLPAPVLLGLADLKKGDAAKAIDDWTKTWPEGILRDSSRIRLNNSFGSADTANISTGWELVRDQPIGTMIHRYYFIVFCTRDPRYLVMSAYHRPDSTWSVEQLQVARSVTTLGGLDEAVFLTAQPPVRQ